LSTIFGNMGAIIIKTDSKNGNLKLLKELAKQLGAQVTVIDDEQYEDFALGQLMQTEQTGELVSREAVFKKLKNK